MNTLCFTKMQSLGNDFMLLDALTREIGLSPEVIKKLSDRKVGIGFDQALMIEPPKNPDKDFCFRIFNADGSEAEQCGNGTRCAASFLLEKQLTKKQTINWESLGGDFSTSYLSQQEIQTNIQLVKSIPETNALELKTLGKCLEVHNISIGNPHAVTFVENIQTVDVNTIGPAISNLDFFPNGVNVGFCQIVDAGFIRLRVFERGVGETQACGTGACAAAIVSASKKLIGHKVKISMPGGKLKLTLPEQKNSILMSGPATKIFDGTVELSSFI